MPNHANYYTIGEYFYKDGIQLKKYRGMGSMDAMKKTSSNERYLAQDENIKVAQGVSGTVITKGSVSIYLPYLVQGVKHGLQDIGSKSITILHNMLEKGEIEFEIRSMSSMRDGGIHGLHDYQK